MTTVPYINIPIDNQVVSIDTIVLWYDGKYPMSGLYEKDCYRYLHWNNLVNAPVTNVMGYTEFIEYAKEYETVSWKIVYLSNTKGESRDVFLWALLMNNKAGVRGEELTWEEILELYKGKS